MTQASEHTTQAFLPTGLRAMIIASSFWAVSLSLTVLAGSIAAVLGCVLASFLIDARLYHPPLKYLQSKSIIGASLVFILITNLVASLLVDSAFVASLISPIGAFNAGEFINWLGIAAGLTIILRTLAHRTSFGAVLEIICVAAAFVITLAAHRNGMIHRPFFIGDFALVRGIDPSVILMAFGCGAVLALSALLMMEQNHKRLP